MQKMSNTKVIKIRMQIHFAQNVGKVWNGRTGIFPAPFGATPSILCSMDREIPKIIKQKKLIFTGAQDTEGKPQLSVLEKCS